MLATATSNTHRYERKFQVRNINVRQLECLIRRHPSHFRVTYPIRIVNNIYFDTPRLTSFMQHVEGSSRRSKLRLRWYGEPQGHIASPSLEIKGRDGDVGSKRRFAIEPFSFEGSLDVAELERNANRSGVAADVLQRLSGSFPSLLNRYTRRYYESTDKRFRITIDSDLFFCVINKRNYGFRKSHAERRLLVVELKYDSADDQVARQAGAALPLRTSKMSKYVYGLERLGISDR